MAKRSQVPFSACPLNRAVTTRGEPRLLCLESFSPLLANFKFLLQRPRLGSQGRREKAIENGVQVIF